MAYKQKAGRPTMAKTGHGIPQHMCSGGGPKQVTSKTTTRRGFGPDGKTRGTYTDTTTNTTSQRQTSYHNSSKNIKNVSLTKSVGFASISWIKKNQPKKI